MITQEPTPGYFRNNFYAAAKDGLEARIIWRNHERVGLRDVILKELVPGLDEVLRQPLRDEITISRQFAVVTGVRDVFQITLLYVQGALVGTNELSGAMRVANILLLHEAKVWAALRIIGGTPRLMSRLNRANVSKSAFLRG